MSTRPPHADEPRDPRAGPRDDGAPRPVAPDPGPPEDPGDEPDADAPPAVAPIRALRLFGGVIVPAVLVAYAVRVLVDDAPSLGGFALSPARALGVAATFAGAAASLHAWIGQARGSRWRLVAGAIGAALLAGGVALMAN